MAQLENGIHFTHVGTLVPDISSYLIIGRLNTSEIFQQITSIRSIETSVSDLVKKIPNSWSTEANYLNKTLALMRLKIDDIEGKAREVRFIFNQTEETTRHGRSIAGAIALVAGGATYIANGFLVNSLQSQLSSFGGIMEKLIGYTVMGAREIQENRERIIHLEEHISKLATHVYLKLTNFKEELELNRFVSDSILLLNLSLLQLSDLEDNVRTILEIVDAALNNQITQSMVNPKQAKAELDKIQLPGYTPVITSLEQFYSLQSYAKIEDDILSVFITIPLINRANKFELYKYINAPINLKNGINVKLNPINEYLAIGPKNSLFKEIKSDDLDDCLKVGRLNLCPNIRIFKKPPTKNCLFDLFVGRFHQAECPGTITKSSNIEVNLIKEDELSISVLNGHHNGLLECPANSSTGAIRRTIPAPQGISLVKMKECSYQIDDIYVFPNKRDTLKFNTNFHLKLKETDVTDLIDIDQEVVKDVLKYTDQLTIEDAQDTNKMIHFLNKTREMEKLKQEFEDIIQFNYVTTIATIVIVISILIIIGLLLYFYKTKIQDMCCPPPNYISREISTGVDAKEEYEEDQ